MYDSTYHCKIGRKLSLFSLPSISMALIFLLVGCQDDEQVAQPEQSVSINGYVQKGPFINGTAITVSELDKELVATGKNFTTQIIDNKGAFSLKNITLQSDFVQLIAEGFYFDEVRGEKSAAQLTLFALADVSNVNSVNVNLLSHLEKDRVTYLMQEEEKSFVVAKQQAQREILTIFGIEKANMAASELLDISQEGDDNAILLAISAILQGNNTVAELSELLANIITDIREDGVLDSESTGGKIRINAMSLALADIRQHLEARYEELGVDATIPNFEQYVDSDGDGFLNKDEDDTPDDFAFEAQVDVAVDTLVISNEVVISGLKEGGKTVAQLRSGKFIDGSLAVTDDSIYFANSTNEASLLVNGQATDSRTPVQVENGDRIQIALQSSDETATVKRASLTIGSIIQIFKITTDDYIPNEFNFTFITNSKRDSLYTSETVTLTGLPHATPISLDKGTLLINDQEVSGSGFNVKENDKIAIRIASSSRYETDTAATVQVGTVSKTFAIRTTLNPWQQKTSPPVSEKSRTVFSAGKDIYVSSHQQKHDLYKYEPTIDQWLAVGEMPFGADNAYYTTTMESKAYCLYRSDFWEYDATTNQWSQKASFPNVGFYFAGTIAASSGRVYFINYSDSNFETNEIWEYTPSSDTWQKKGSTPFESSFYVNTFSLEEKIYVIYPDRSPNPTRTELWEYDVTNSEWIQKNDVPFNPSYGSSFVVQNKGYFVLGNIDKHASYDQTNDEWQFFDQAPEGISTGISSGEKGCGLGYDGKFYEFTPPQD